MHKDAPPAGWASPGAHGAQADAPGAPAEVPASHGVQAVLALRGE
jgi:hypothetical protein